MTVDIKAPDGSIVRFPDGTGDDVIVKVMRENFGGPAAAAPAAPSLPSWSEAPVARAKDLFTGELRTEFPDAPEFTRAYMDTARDEQGNLRELAPESVASSAVTPDPKAQLDILKKNIPGLESKTDKFGNIMLKSPGMTDWSYLNKPGASGRDVDELATGTLATLFLSRLFGAGKTIPGRVVWGGAAAGAGSVTQDLAAMAQGSEQGIDAERAAVSTGVGGVLGPVLGTKTAEPGLTPRTAALQAAERRGIEVPAGAAFENFALRSTAGALKEVPVVGTPIVKAANKATSEIERQVGQLGDDLGSKSMLNAGESLRDDIAQWIKVVSKDEAEDLYAPVEALVNQQAKMPLRVTRRIAQEIVDEAKESGLRAPSIIGELETALKGELSWKGLQNLRTQIGDRLSGDIAPEAGMSKRALKAIYGGLSEDMAWFAKKNGGDKGLRAWQSANEAFEQHIAQRREALSKIIGRDAGNSPESIVEKLVTMAGSKQGADITRVLLAKTTVGRRSWEELGSAIIGRMGHTKDGFSIAHFRTAYEKLSPNGKDALFGRSDVRKTLDDLALVGKQFEDLQKLGNPSGSGRLGSIIGGGAYAIAAPQLALANAIGGYALARVLAKPATAKAASRWMRAYLMSATPGNQAAATVLTQASRQLEEAMQREGIQGEGRAQ